MNCHEKSSLTQQGTRRHEQKALLHKQPIMSSLAQLDESCMIASTMSLLLALSAATALAREHCTCETTSSMSLGSMPVSSTSPSSSTSSTLADSATVLSIASGLDANCWAAEACA